MAFLGTLPRTPNPLDNFLTAVAHAPGEIMEARAQQQKLAILQQHADLQDRAQKLDTLRTIGGYSRPTRKMFGPALLSVAGLSANAEVTEAFANTVAGDDKMWDLAVQAADTTAVDPLARAGLQAALASGDPMEVMRELRHAANLTVQRENAKAQQEYRQAQLDALTEHRQLMAGIAQERNAIAQERVGISQQNADTRSSALDLRRQGKGGNTPTIAPPPPNAFEDDQPAEPSGPGLIERGTTAIDQIPGRRDATMIPGYRLQSILSGLWDFAKGTWSDDAP